MGTKQQPGSPPLWSDNPGKTAWGAWLTQIAAPTCKAERGVSQQSHVHGSGQGYMKHGRGRDLAGAGQFWMSKTLTVPHQVNLAGQFHANTMKLVRKQTELL